MSDKEQIFRNPLEDGSLEPGTLGVIVRWDG